MKKLHVAFQEGFAHDLGLILINGKEVLRKTDLNTRLQIGRAFADDLEVGDGPVEVEFQFPHRNLSRKTTIDPSEPVYLGISITPEGELSLKISHEPFGYV